VMEFADKTTAESIASKLRFNKPRVMSYDAARIIANSQKHMCEQPMFHQAHLEPWDDHKSTMELWR
jgi:hypothetical protein